MNNLTKTLDALAHILTYPSDDFRVRVTECRDAMSDVDGGSEIAGRFGAFAKAIDGLTKEEMEELYTRTFDINPVSSLEVGWHLYGETYERGAFLVQMRDLLRRCSVEESSELPDHITSVLVAVGRMEEAEAVEFVSSRVLKALNKMLEGFAGQANPYEHVLVSVQLLLARLATTHEGVES